MLKMKVYIDTDDDRYKTDPFAQEMIVALEKSINTDPNVIGYLKMIQANIDRSIHIPPQGTVQ